MRGYIVKSGNGKTLTKELFWYERDDWEGEDMFFLKMVLNIYVQYVLIG